MTPLDRGWPRLRRVFRLPFNARRIDRDLYEEFAFHIQERVDQFVATGMPRADAEAEVARRFGNYESYRQQARQIDEATMRQRTWIETGETLRRELRLAARVLWRTPAFSWIAFATLALGIGATTAIYTVLDAVVLRPLPYADSEQLVSVLHPATVPGNGERIWGMSAGGYFFMKKENRSFSEFGMYRTSTLTVTGGASAEVVREGVVTPSMFRVFRAKPEVGRLADDADGRPESPLTAVLSYEFWQRRFGGVWMHSRRLCPALRRPAWRCLRQRHRARLQPKWRPTPRRRNTRSSRPAAWAPTSCTTWSCHWATSVRLRPRWH